MGDIGTWKFQFCHFESQNWKKLRFTKHNVLNSRRLHGSRTSYFHSSCWFQFPEYLLNLITSVSKHYASSVNICCIKKTGKKVCSLLSETNWFRCRVIILTKFLYRSKNIIVIFILLWIFRTSAFILSTNYWGYHWVCFCWKEICVLEIRATI